MYTQEPEYNKETITSDELFKLARRSKKPKIYNPKTNRMIVIDGPAYNVLIRNGYMHWKEEKVLVPPIHEKLVLGNWFAFISNRIWDIAYNPEKSLLSLIDRKTSLLQVLLEVYNDYTIRSCRIAIASPPKSLEEEIIREIAKRILQNRYGFSEDRVEALFDLQSDLRHLSVQENENKTKENVSSSTVNIVISKRQSLHSSKDQFRLGILRQEESSIMEYYTKVKKCGKLAGYNEVQLKYHFLRGLSQKDSKFVREETTAPLGLAVIPLTFTSNVIKNHRLSNYESITIPTEVLVEKYGPQMPNFILLGNNWFYGRNNDGFQTYLPEIVTDAENALVRTTLRIKDLGWKVGTAKAKRKPRVNVYVNKRLNTSNSDTSSNSDVSDSDSSDSSNSSSSCSGSEDKHIYKTVAVIHPKRCRK
ncbi:10746_t:CDS:2, partial [Entrophospora sp. SA101]